MLGRTGDNWSPPNRIAGTMPGMSPVPNSPAGRRVYKLDREHVFHSWSAQGSLDPITIERAEGAYLWDFDGKQYLDFCSQLMFTNLRRYQHPRSWPQSPSRPTSCARSDHRLRWLRGVRAQAITELLARHPPEGVLHQRWCRCERERDADGSAVHQPRQGVERLPLVSRKHQRGDHGDG